MGCYQKLPATANTTIATDPVQTGARRAPGCGAPLTCQLTGRLSELPWSVDVGAVFDGHDVDAAVLVVDAIDHPVIAAAGAVQPVEPELKRAAHPARAGGHWP